jgi:hypothetical protein
MDPYIQEHHEAVIDYGNKVDEAYAKRVEENLDPTIQDYYNSKGYTKTLTE